MTIDDVLDLDAVHKEDCEYHVRNDNCDPWTFTELSRDEKTIKSECDCGVIIVSAVMARSFLYPADEPGNF